MVRPAVMEKALQDGEDSCARSHLGNLAEEEALMRAVLPY